ncbi:MAG: TolC family protein [Bacteroidales bacterium]|jgi:cobalt-zinc-cadmium efflux system outer membrane protein|nr:TolC family protein [Bacteroidales bacterium]
MNKIKYILGLFFMLISFTLSAQHDLDVYLQSAAENNPGLKAKFKEYMAALEVIPQVGALPDPTLALGYFISPVETRVGPQRLKISAAQMFPWFGTLQAKENVSIQAAKAKYEVFLEAKSKLFNEVRSTYFNVYFNRRAIDITRENLTILGSFQNMATIKVEAGKVSAVDEYRIEMEIGDLENQLALLLDKQDVLELMFNNLLNVAGDMPVLTPDTLWTDDIRLDKEQILDTIMSNNHQLLVLSLQQEALGFRKEVAEKLGKPDFSLGLDYTFIGKGSNNLEGTDAFVFPMVGITIPLYRNKYKAMVKELVFLQEAKDFEKIDKVNLLETILENAWKDYLDADRRVSLFNSQLELAGHSLKLLETEYVTGDKNFEELLRMERSVLKYYLELEKARSDKQASISFITYLMGA